MKTEHKLANALRTMMTEMPLDEISVTLLTDKCGVSRKTFYYHFHDIYDLLTLVFLDEEIPNLSDCKNVKDLVKTIYKYYSKNAKFIDATLFSAGKELFQEFIFNSCYQHILKFVNQIPDAKKLKPSEKKNVARFFSLAYAHTIIYYLTTYKSKSLDGLFSCFSFLQEDFLEISVDKILRNKGLKND